VVVRRPWLIPALYAGGFGLYALLLALAWPAADTNVARVQTLLNSPDLVALACFLLSVVHAGWILRTTTDPVERRQIRWVAWGIVVAIVPWTALSVIPEVLGRVALVPPVAIGLLWCALPTSLAIAILRERLFDIDLLVNRTLVYGVLSGLLALIYFGVVILLQAALGLLTGQSNSQLVIVLSTLTIAALFTPLRGRVQTVIDRRFNRKHYDAGRTLAAFGLAARTIVDLQPLSDQLADVVQETMEPAHVGFAWVDQPALPPELPRS
jgi:hypothetical protein